MHTIEDAMPHMVNPDRWNKGTLHTGGVFALNLPDQGNRALMPTGNGGYIPAADDPTDPSTWSVLHVFTS